MMAVGEDESHYYDSEVSRILRNKKKPEKVEPVRDSDVIKTTQGFVDANKETAVFG